MASTSPKRLDQHGPEGKALQTAVKTKLKDFLGEDYNDDVLPLYVVVMMAHGTTQPVVAENLDAFLGENAVAFTSWSTCEFGTKTSVDISIRETPRRLFQHMGKMGKVDALKVAERVGLAAAAAQSAVAPPQQPSGPQASQQLSLTASDMSDDSASTGSGAGGPDAEAAVASAEPPASAPEPTDHRLDRSRRHSDGHQDSTRHDRAKEDRHRDRSLAERERRSDRDRYESRHQYSERRREPPQHYDRHYDHRGRGAWDDHAWPRGRDEYGWPPFRQDPYYDRDYGGGPHPRERQRYRSLSPPRHVYRNTGEGRRPEPWAGPRSDQHDDRGPPEAERWQRSGHTAERRYSGGSQDRPLVPPPVDFESRAGVAPDSQRQRLTSQLAHPRQAMAAEVTVGNGDFSMVEMQTGSAPMPVVAAQSSQELQAANAAVAHYPSAFQRLSAQPGTQLFSRSLPADVTPARQDAFSPDFGTQSQQQQHYAAQQQQRRQQARSVFARLAGGAAAGNGTVFDRLAPPTGALPQPSQPQEDRRQQTFQPTNNMRSSVSLDRQKVTAIEARLAQMSGTLEQLRAAAQLEHTGRQGPSLHPLVPGQGPPDLRSITVTSVHPLALEHSSILRAHFSVSGRIVRATVLRDQRTGLPSGKAHIEYADVLASRKAMRLSHSLLLDRPVRVRPKKIRAQ